MTLGTAMPSPADAGLNPDDFSKNE